MSFIKNIQAEKPLTQKTNYDSQVVLERTTNRFYLYLPMPLQLRSEDHALMSNECECLEPGHKTSEAMAHEKSCRKNKYRQVVRHWRQTLVKFLCTDF